MKNNRFISRCLKSSLLALFIGISSARVVKAQNRFNPNVLNGLFTPTQSERFFQAGRENFQREVEILNYPERYLRDDLLQIDSTLIQQEGRLEKFTTEDLKDTLDIPSVKAKLGHCLDSSNKIKQN